MRWREGALGPTLESRIFALLVVPLTIAALVLGACGIGTTAIEDGLDEVDPNPTAADGAPGDNTAGDEATDDGTADADDGSTHADGSSDDGDDSADGADGGDDGADGGDDGADGGDDPSSDGDEAGSGGSPNGPGADGDRQLGSVLLLGDSITEGLPHAYRYPLWAGLTEAGYEFDFVGRWSSAGWESTTPTVGGRTFDQDHDGTTGAWVTDVGTNLDDFLTEGTPPDLALVHVGTNDIAAGSRPPPSEVEAIIDGIAGANADATILLALIIPVFGAPEANELIDTFNDDLASIAASRPSVVIVDMNTGFQVEVNYEDELHPSALGAEEIAARWQEAIDRVNGHQ